MKRILLSSAFLLALAIRSFGQLADGSIAPDFTIQDINGNTQHLYSYLDSGKTMVIDFFEVMCGPCWNYHETHSLANAYNAWGPPGTNELMVLEVEGIKSSVNQIRGLEKPSYGDWTAGEPFPFIATCSPNTDEIVTTYRVPYFPTVYMICHDRRIKLIGPVDTSMIHARMNQCPAAPSDSLYLDLVAVDSMKYVTCNNYIHLFLKFQNYGIKTLTSAKIRMNLDNAVFDTLSWTGNLNTYDILDFDGEIINGLSDGSHTISYVISELNGLNSGFRSDTIIRRFTVLNSWQTPPFVQDFSNTGFPYDKWTIRNYFPYIQTWERADLGYRQALRIPFYNIPQSYSSTVFLPGLSFTSNDKPCLRFDLACTLNNSVIRKAGIDYIFVDYSTDCGRSFTNIGTVSELENTTAPDDSTYFIPTDQQWKPMAIDLSKLALTDNVILAITSSSSNGNNLYISNIRIDNSSGIGNNIPNDKLELYPLPARDVLYARFTSAVKEAKLELYSQSGQIVYSAHTQLSSVVKIPLRNLTQGCYIFRATLKDEVITRMVMVE
jgi:hypothetical protein